MKKFFIASDIHGFYDEWMKALTEKGFDESNPEHIIVVLGDLLDRGPKPYSCLKFVNHLPAERKILIRGNHEDLIEESLVRKEFLRHDYHNGTAQTVWDIASIQKEYVDCGPDEVFDLVENNIQFKTYINSLIDYYEDDESIFVHGWIPCETSGWGEVFRPIENWKEGNWYKARWVNGMKAWASGVKVEDKTIYCGHWHTSYGNAILHNDGSEFGENANFNPFIDEGICAIDACTAYSKQVNVVVIEKE